MVVVVNLNLTEPEPEPEPWQPAASEPGLSTDGGGRGSSTNHGQPR